jgi:hypothetical protein
MRLEHGLNARRPRSAAVLGSITVLLALGAACSGSSEEETPAAAATTGAEAPPAPPAPEPAAEPSPPPPAPEPPAPAANTAQPPQMPTSAGVVIQTVKDYDAWKKAFDEHQQARKDAGALGDGVMRGVDNPKLIAVYLPTNDIAKLKEFTASKDLKDKMKEAGVVGKPTIYLFNNAGGKMAPPDKASLFGAIIELDTKDFAAFKTALDAQQPARDAAGIVGYGLGQGVEKPNTAYLYLQSDDAIKLKAYLAAKETKQAFKDAGVKNTLKPTVVQEATMTMYQQ